MVPSSVPDHSPRPAARAAAGHRVTTATGSVPIVVPSTATGPISIEGLTSDAGWELRLERELPLSPDEAWDRLVSEWLPAWLEVDAIPMLVGGELHAKRRRVGRVLGCSVHRRVKVRWTASTMDHETIVDASLDRTSRESVVLTLHQERMLGPAEREQEIARWNSALDELEAEIGERDDLDLTEIES